MDTTDNLNKMLKYYKCTSCSEISFNTEIVNKYLCNSCIVNSTTNNSSSNDNISLTFTKKEKDAIIKYYNDLIELKNLLSS